MLAWALMHCVVLMPRARPFDFSISTLLGGMRNSLRNGGVSVLPDVYKTVQCSADAKKQPVHSNTLLRGATAAAKAATTEGGLEPARCTGLQNKSAMSEA